ncbi:MAG: type II secretion system F family protein [Oscillospiraceae bacterium]|nr:type II secretion system F family protein [Oscillospiraceae bacterium]
MEIFLFLIAAVLFAYGFWRVCAALLYHDRFSIGRKHLRQMEKWSREKQDLWDHQPLRSITQLLSRFVFLDDTAKEALQRQLQKAGMQLSPEQFTARGYLIYLLCGIGLLLCSAMQFWFGTILCILFAIYGVLRQKEILSTKIKLRDEAITAEMPRFVRTLCRTLRHNRDIHAALSSYHKVAGPVLGAEIYILLTQMRTGGVPAALQQFQKRIGTESAFRLCSTLQEIDRGIDQTSTLEYLADDMARQAKLNIQKTLSKRPGQMRATYLPAVLVCVIMIIYVLIVFIMHQLNDLY